MVGTRRTAASTGALSEASVAAADAKAVAAAVAAPMATSQPAIASDKPEPSLLSQIWRKTYRLHKHADVPPVLQYNRFVLTGYRAHLSTLQTVSSLFHVHNESGNIWSHGLALLFFTASYIRGLFVFDATAQFLWACQFAAMAVCLSMSVLYHGFQCHGECSVTSYQYWLGLDLKGIVFAYVASSMRRIWYSLYCHPFHRAVSYATLLGGVALVAVAMNSQFALRSPLARVLAFGTLMISVNVSTFFMVRLQSGSDTGRQLHIWAIILQVIGSTINASRLPERLLPGRFDYVLNSHQIMHLFSVVGVWCTWEGCTYDMVHAHGTPC